MASSPGLAYSARCRLLYRWTCEFRARIGFARYRRLARLEAFSGSMHDRKSRVASLIYRDSLIRAEMSGLDGGAEGI
jgi:hypothetical protein